MKIIDDYSDQEFADDYRYEAFNYRDWQDKTITPEVYKQISGIIIEGVLKGQSKGKQLGWISVEEALPPLNKLVIVCAKSIDPTYGWFDGAFWAINDEPDYSKTKINHITFVERWQPLPTK